MNLDNVRKNPAFYSACGWCWSRLGATSCTCTEPCTQPSCPMKEDQELMPTPQPIPRFEQ